MPRLAETLAQYVRLVAEISGALEANLSALLLMLGLWSKRCWENCSADSDFRPQPMSPAPYKPDSNY